MHTRLAVPGDAPAVAALISLAYRVEDFFKTGDRTDEADVRARMAKSAFLLLEDAGGLAGCVYVDVRGETGYFGMLSVDPARQGHGLGARLIAAAEDHCRHAGCREMEIEVVHLRTELPPFYRRFGYLESGTRPFFDQEHSRLPCHLIVMTKSLLPEG
jgi:GNAT superfamily N-acetyltransferase